MDAVGQVQRSLAGDPVEEKRIKHEAVLGREITVDGVEAPHVSRPEIARRIHAGEKNRDAAPLEPGDDRVERALRRGRIESAQHVVGAEFEDDAVGAVRHRPVEPIEAARRGVAGDAGIDDLDIVTARLERPLEHRREGGALRQAVAGREAIAEGDDPERAARRGLRPALQKETSHPGHQDQPCQPPSLAQRAKPPI